MKKLLSALTCISLLGTTPVAVQAKSKIKCVYSPAHTYKWAKVSGNKWSFRAASVESSKLMVLKDAKKGRKTISNDFLTWVVKSPAKRKVKTYTFYSTPSTKYYEVVNTGSGEGAKVTKLSKKDMIAMFKEVPKRITASTTFQVNGSKIKNIYLSDEI